MTFRLWRCFHSFGEQNCLFLSNFQMRGGDSSSSNSSSSSSSSSHSESEGDDDRKKEKKKTKKAPKEEVDKKASKELKLVAKLGKITSRIENRAL